jgi:alpha-tubulin suppressor-like RCC1 family protein
MGREHTCVTTPAGAIACWGMNHYRQQAETSFQATGSPVTVAAVSGAQRITGGDLHTCGLFGTEIKCWGLAGYGALGDGKTPWQQPDPVVFATGEATDVGAGYHFTCALLSSKQVACSGLNEDSRLGRTGGNISTPAIIQVTVPGDPDAGADGGPAGPTTAPFSDVARIAIGRFHSCAVHGGGKVSCWGSPWDGRLGVPGNSPRAEPALVPVGAVATDVATGGGHTCAVLEDGSVRCWGANDVGQVSGGGGSGTQLRTPNLGDKKAKTVALGDAHSCALYTDGTVGCWGRGKHGQLGNGLRSDATQPVAVKDLTGVKAIDADENRTCAVLNDGSVYCWGSNTVGGLGDGVVMHTGVPGAVFGY